jgi:hypothetical protein
MFVSCQCPDESLPTTRAIHSMGEAIFQRESLTDPDDMSISALPPVTAGIWVRVSSTWSALTAQMVVRTGPPATRIARRGLYLRPTRSGLSHQRALPGKTQP